MAELTLQPSSAALPGACDECRGICRLWTAAMTDSGIRRGCQAGHMGRRYAEAAADLESRAAQTSLVSGGSR